jgi:hypothetical protein
MEEKSLSTFNNFNMAEDKPLTEAVDKSFIYMLTEMKSVMQAFIEYLTITIKISCSTLRKE